MSKSPKKKKLKIQGNVQNILDELGWTQKMCEEMSGVPQGTISRFDKSSRHSIQTLFLLSRTFNRPIEDLFTVEEIEE